eukprot:8083527-Pyramimonas_sp.AAC.1
MSPPSAAPPRAPTMMAAARARRASMAAASAILGFGLHCPRPQRLHTHMQRCRLFHRSPCRAK